MPQDIDLVAGAPHLRRRYLDDTICQMDPQYCRELQEYGRVLTQRNHLLKSLRRQRNDSAQLLFWDQRLVEHGAYLTLRRQQVIQQLDEFAQNIHPELTGDKERLRLEYCASARMESRPGAAYQIPLLSKQDVSPEADPSLRDVAASFGSKLQEVRAKELEQGMSIIGPHRDDLRFMVNGVDMNTYGSRGQQRTITLSLKLAEVKWITQEKNDKPVLLLDDVVSELDAAHRGCVLDAIDRAQQVVVTTTGLIHYDKEFLTRATLWQVCAGRIENLTLP
jgi:DNA replication and repair protein RecF